MPGKRGSAGETPRWERVPCCGGVRDPPPPGASPQTRSPVSTSGGGVVGPDRGRAHKAPGGRSQRPRPRNRGTVLGPLPCPPNPAVHGAVKIVADHT